MVRDELTDQCSHWVLTSWVFPLCSHHVSPVHVRDFGPPPRGGDCPRRETRGRAGPRGSGGPPPPPLPRGRARGGPRRPPQNAFGRVGICGQVQNGAPVRDFGTRVRAAGVLGPIPKREEPGKTGAPCVKVPASSRVPVHTGLGSSSLIAHVLHYPPPLTRTAL